MILFDGYERIRVAEGFSVLSNSLSYKVINPAFCGVTDLIKFLSDVQKVFGLFYFYHFTNTAFSGTLPQAVIRISDM
jgi:hypothetical protein